MEKTDIRYQTYVKILKNELVPAMGCTEPISLAYAAAVARNTLGYLPERIEVYASGSIIKNVKSVVVPNTNGLKGISAAVAAGTYAGDASKELEAISSVSEEEKLGIQAYLKDTEITVHYLKSNHVFHLMVDSYFEGHCVRVEIVDTHRNIVLIRKDEEVLLKKEIQEEKATPVETVDYSLLNMEDIFDFIQTMDVKDVEETLDRQIEYNMAIAQAGLDGDWGANIGSTLLAAYGDDIRVQAKANAAAASDARMNGCELPVIINSGSGNQGITCSVPVITYARWLNCSHEKMLRALALSNLTTIHQKTRIGTLSAFCGVVSAGAAAGAGISYLLTEDYNHCAHTVVNSLAVVSGMICDGAKPSCAAKIAESIDSALLAHAMYENGQQFYGGDGIVFKGIEKTLDSVGFLGKEGMKETNEKIIQLMVKN